MDNSATHKKAEVRGWLVKNPRIHVHFTPTSGSWLNLVEVWFAIIDPQAIRRGTFGSVRDCDSGRLARLAGKIHTLSGSIHGQQTVQIPICITASATCAAGTRR